MTPKLINPENSRPVFEETTRLMAEENGRPRGSISPDPSPSECGHEAIYYYADLPIGWVRRATSMSHSSIRETGTTGFQHCVNPRDCNPSAHGYITIKERCYRCGAARMVNENGRHVETGPLGRTPPGDPAGRR